MCQLTWSSRGCPATPDTSPPGLGTPSGGLPEGCAPRHVSQQGRGAAGVCMARVPASPTPGVLRGEPALPGEDTPCTALTETVNPDPGQLLQ